MKVISELSDMISEEIEDADKYVSCALRYKDTYKNLAEVLFTISTEEMRHMSMLHTEVVKLIEQYRREKGEPPADMLAVYDYLHKKQIENASSVKSKQTLFKET